MHRSLSALKYYYDLDFGMIIVSNVSKVLSKAIYFVYLVGLELCLYIYITKFWCIHVDSSPILLVRRYFLVLLYSVLI